MPVESPKIIGDLTLTMLQNKISRSASGAENAILDAKILKAAGLEGVSDPYERIYSALSSHIEKYGMNDDLTRQFESLVRNVSDDSPYHIKQALSAYRQGVSMHAVAVKSGFAVNPSGAGLRGSAIIKSTPKSIDVPGSIGDLKKLKIQMRTAAGEELKALEASMAERFPGGKLSMISESGQYAGGEWDWWKEGKLSKQEKARLRKNWMIKGSETGKAGLAPDIMFAEKGMSDEWLDLTRRIDILKNFKNTGRLPKNISAYGDIDIDSVLRGAVGGLETDLRVGVSASRLLSGEVDQALSYYQDLLEESAEAFGEKYTRPTKLLSRPVDKAEAVISKTASTADESIESLTGAIEDIVDDVGEVIFEAR